MVFTVGDIERIKSALEEKNMSVTECLMLIKNRLVCDECEYKKNFLSSSEDPEKEITRDGE